MMRVLSIQSHVAFGHVGNAVAAFALQRLGIEVLVVPTVVLSNHAAYPTVRGKPLRPEVVGEIVEGVSERGALGNCAAVLSGYLGDAAVGATVVDAVARARAANPGALYACDPVMGEAAKGLYVDAAIPGFFTDTALPAADIITPNAFEAELLTGKRTRSRKEARAAAETLLGMGPSTVTITSLLRENGPSGIEVLAANRSEAWIVSTPEVGGHMSGAGDLFAALWLGHRLRGAALPEALELTVSAIHGVLRRTREEGRTELALVAAQDELIVPSRRYRAERL